MNSSTITAHLATLSNKPKNKNDDDATVSDIEATNQNLMIQDNVIQANNTNKNKKRKHSTNTNETEEQKQILQTPQRVKVNNSGFKHFLQNTLPFNMNPQKSDKKMAELLDEIASLQYQNHALRSQYSQGNNIFCLVLSEHKKLAEEHIKLMTEYSTLFNSYNQLLSSVSLLKSSAYGQQTLFRQQPAQAYSFSELQPILNLLSNNAAPNNQLNINNNMHR